MKERSTWYFINPITGSDKAAGTYEAPIRSFKELAVRVGLLRYGAAVTVVFSGGLLDMPVLNELALTHPLLIMSEDKYLERRQQATTRPN